LQGRRRNLGTIDADTIDAELIIPGDGFEVHGGNNPGIIRYLDVYSSNLSDISSVENVFASRRTGG